MDKVVRSLRIVARALGLAQRCSCLSESIATPPKPSYYERRAPELLQEILGGCCEWRDTPCAQGTHDFDIRLPTGELIAVEVTRVTDESLERVWARDNPWPAPRLKKHWLLRVSPQSWDHKKIDKVQRSFERLEQLGVEEFRTHLDNEQDLPAQARPEVERLGGLGVIAGRARPGSGRIEIFTVETSVGDPLVVPKDIAEGEAHKEDNKRKLSKAKEAKERHLLIWVNPFAGLDSYIWEAAEHVRDVQPASLPPEVDVVWIAIEREGSGGKSVLLLNQKRGGRWRTALRAPDPCSNRPDPQGRRGAPQGGRPADPGTARGRVVGGAGGEGLQTSSPWAATPRKTRNGT